MECVLRLLGPFECKLLYLSMLFIFHPRLDASKCVLGDGDGNGEQEGIIYVAGVGDIVCQMLSRWMKNCLYSINI